LAAGNRPAVALMGYAASVRGTPSRRILLAGLTEGDTRRLQVFLLADSERLRQHWHIAVEGPADVCLYDGGEPPAAAAGAEQAPYQVRIVDAARPVRPGDLSVLQRPLQYDDFIDILVAIERGARSLAAAAAPLQVSRDRVRRWTGIGLLTRMCAKLGLRLEGR